MKIMTETRTDIMTGGMGMREMMTSMGGIEKEETARTTGITTQMTMRMSRAKTVNITTTTEEIMGTEDMTMISSINININTKATATASGETIIRPRGPSLNFERHTLNV
ncbi:hypothetical protein PV04_10023 [Phialophora macrospora]|uniref:Uncharacterized protein n=1 Tax=Phialophora macrospora TaxID=1851006 RepID=A0A0D2F8C3_9EURO|nr:hypothetical protein PV04_10023 [Phialophora macrospora]